VTLAVLVAAVVALGALVPVVRRARREQTARTHYYAALDQIKRGDLKAAEEELRRSLSLDPGLPGGKEQLERITAPRPLEPREQAVKLQPPPAQHGISPGARVPLKHPPHVPSPFAITRYALDVELDPARGGLRATATIHLRQRAGPEAPTGGVRTLELALAPEFEVIEATQDGRPVAVRQVNDLLTLTTAAPLRADRDAALRVRYRRRVTGPQLHGGDWIAPEGSYLRAEGRWYPGTGELDFRAPVAVSVSVPRGYTAIAPGRLAAVERPPGRAVFRWQTDRPAAMIAVAAARYQRFATPGSTPLTAYVFPRHARRAAPFLREADRILRFYASRFGEYPFEKLAIVEIPRFPGGYGTTSFLMLTEASFAAKGLPVHFLAHEIGHQWWGNSVFPQGPGAGWLSEAFAEYGSYLYAEHVHGRAGLTRVLRRAGEQYRAASARTVEEPIRETDPYDQRGAYREVIYFKGALVLHALRDALGDPTFTRILRRFAADYHLGKASIADFQQVAEREAGQPLGWFFDQWLGRTGAPRLVYRAQTERGADGTSRAVVELRQEGPPYRIPLVLLLDAQNQISRHRVWVNGPRERWSFPIPAPLSLLGLDPDESVLKMPPRWEVAGSPS
jgi:aminopeptidase N